MHHCWTEHCHSSFFLVHLYSYIFKFRTTFLACCTHMPHMTTLSFVCPVCMYTSLPVSVSNSLRKAAVGCQNVWSSCDLASVSTSSTIWVFLATQGFIVYSSCQGLELWWWQCQSVTAMLPNSRLPVRWSVEWCGFLSLLHWYQNPLYRAGCL